MNETKAKYAIYLYPSQMEEVKSLLSQANAKSQSEFVSDAIRFYIGYLRQGKNVDYLAPVIAQSIKEEIGGVEKNLSQMLFKLAVEVGMASHLQAAGMKVSGDQMKSLREMCSGDIAKNNGVIRFEDAYRFQHKDR